MAGQALTGVPARPQVSWRAHGRGPALVLVNGYAASAIAWPREWLHSLERRYRVITMDNRGCGWSRFVDTPFTMADLAADVADVLDAAEEESATILDLSMGGMIAQEFAIRTPEHVAGLVLVATRPSIPRFRQPSLLVALELMRQPAHRESLEAHLRRLWSTAAASGFADRHPQVIAELMSCPSPHSNRYPRFRGKPRACAVSRPCE